MRSDPAIYIADSNGDCSRALLQRIERLGLASSVVTEQRDGVLKIRLKADLQARLMPEHDTLSLRQHLTFDAAASDLVLEREIVVTLLATPVPFHFPNVGEFESAVRMRHEIVTIAQRTELAFDTEAAERPSDCWTYREDTGFTVVPGHLLTDALAKAMRLDGHGRHYAFSCYRATEYVMLLALARELQRVNPAMFDRLQRQWEVQAIMSGRFHDTFLREYGTLEDPLPLHYYVPGDRVWFRNPDERSSDVPGYEGSWVFYLGDNRFADFWRSGQPYTIESKCIEIFHWRDGVASTADGRLRIDEEAVEACVRRTMTDPQRRAEVLACMQQLRAPKGTYGVGGCLDASRECLRFVHPQTSDIYLP